MLEHHQAAIVGCPYTTIPAHYALELYGDPLKALAARNLFLFATYDTDWWIAQARSVRADVVVAVEPPNRYPSILAQACEAENLPFLSLPSSADSEENKQLIDSFFNARKD